MKHLVVGSGEVGSALWVVLNDAVSVVIRDMDPHDGCYDVLHVAFPWGERFEAEVKAYADHHEADLVVVHSTVPVGTCDPHGWVHSPVTGRHPHLSTSLRAFTKRFGGARATDAAAAFARAQVTVQVLPRAIDTEAGKLWELVQFGLQVRIQKAIHAWCEANGCDPDIVYTQFARHYNAGYTALGHPHLTRPVLEHQPGPIGGHCVTQCSALLDHPLAELVTTPPARNLT